MPDNRARLGFKGTRFACLVALLSPHLVVTGPRAWIISCYQTRTQSPLIFYSQWHLGRFWWRKGAWEGGRKSSIFFPSFPWCKANSPKNFPSITVRKARNDCVRVWVVTATLNRFYPNFSPPFVSTFFCSWLKWNEWNFTEGWLDTSKRLG